MHGTLDAELEVQRTSKRAELTAFLCLLKKVIGPTMVHVDNKGIIDGLWRSEQKCIGPKAKDADLWTMICEKLHRVHQEVFWWRSSTPKRTDRRRSGSKYCLLKSLPRKKTRKQMDGASESHDGAARKRGGLCSLAVCGQLSLYGRRMERL